MPISNELEQPLLAQQAKQPKLLDRATPFLGCSANSMIYWESLFNFPYHYNLDLSITHKWLLMAGSALSALTINIASLPTYRKNYNHYRQISTSQKSERHLHTKKLGASIKALTTGSSVFNYCMDYIPRTSLGIFSGALIWVIDTVLMFFPEYALMRDSGNSAEKSTILQLSPKNAFYLSQLLTLGKSVGGAILRYNAIINFLLQQAWMSEPRPTPFNKKAHLFWLLSCGMMTFVIAIQYAFGRQRLQRLLTREGQEPEEISTTKKRIIQCFSLIDALIFEPASVFTACANMPINFTQLILDTSKVNNADKILRHIKPMLYAIAALFTLAFIPMRYIILSSSGKSQNSARSSSNPHRLTTAWSESEEGSETKSDLEKSFIPAKQTKRTFCAIL